MKQPFSDLDVIRARARADATSGAVTGAYHADRARVVEALNELLATANTISLACREYSHATHRSRVVDVAPRFAEHAEQQQKIIERLAIRIVQLRGHPTFRLEELIARSHVALPHADTAEQMVREMLVAARVQIETMCAVARWIGDRDLSTRRLLEDGLEFAEGLADEMDRLLVAVGALEPQPVSAQARVQQERARYSDNFDKPPWWDPQWIAARG